MCAPPTRKALVNPLHAVGNLRPPVRHRQPSSAHTGKTDATSLDQLKSRSSAERTRYFALFVNRLAYTLQSHKPGTNGKHYYYRPKQDCRLSLQTTRDHLNGQLTIGVYALNPTTQRSKWVAIDADYENALEDLLKLQWELASGWS
jgi:hypothetical protein